MVQFSGATIPGTPGTGTVTLLYKKEHKRFLEMNKRYLIAIPSFLLALWVGWGKDFSKFFDMASLLSLLMGTYVISKVTFVEFMLERYRNDWENFQKPTNFFKFICFLYYIDISDLGSDAVAPNYEKFRKAVSFYDPFRGFAWILFGSAIQFFKIVLF